MFDMKEIGKKISSLRKERNMTQMELADKLGISFQAVSNWERGNTMPDISKLPELAEIFRVSIDDLLNGRASLVNAVLDDTVDAYMEEDKATEQEIADILPILKPGQTKKILEKADVSKFHDIGSFLPFMDEDNVNELALKALEQGDSVDKFLPFMDEDDVSELAIKALEQGDSADKFLPFMDEDGVSELAIKALGQGDSVDKFLPFMDEDSVNDLAVKALEQGDSVDKFLPFMDEDSVNDLAVKALEQGDSVDKFLPFMCEDDIARLAIKIFGTKKKQ